jgi:DNA-binding response OmpR family regulator
VRITQALAFLLQDAGYAVTSCNSGAQALNLLEPNAKPVDIVIVDVMMPRMDGYEVCRQFRARSSHYMPIIMLTARDETTSKLLGLEVGADVYITKPFVPNELLAQAKSLLRLAQHSKLHYSAGPL